MEFDQKNPSTTCSKTFTTVRPISTYAASQGWYSSNSTKATIIPITNPTANTININQAQQMMNLPAKTNSVGACRVNVVDLPEVVVMETMFINTHAIEQNKLDNTYNTHEGNPASNVVMASRYGNRLLTKDVANVQPNDSERPIKQFFQTRKILRRPENHVDAMPETVITTVPTSTNSRIFCASSSVSNSQAQSVDVKSKAGNIISQPQKLQRRNPIKISIRHSSQQTEPQQKQDIGIQCNRYESDESQDGNYLESIRRTVKTTSKLNDVESKESLIKFVNENAIHYCGKLYECKICGDVSKGIRKLCRHMYMHWAPKILCAKCGEFVENRGLLNENKNCLRCKEYWGGGLHCPHYRCNAVAISTLELYDHINEHMRIKEYNCTACYKGFCTAAEFLRHLFLNAKCYRKSKRTRHLYGLLSSTTSKRNRRYRLRVFALHTRNSRRVFVKAPLSNRRAIVHICQLCLKRFLNKKLYQKHVNRCLTSYKLRFLYNWDKPE